LQLFLGTRGCLWLLVSSFLGIVIGDNTWLLALQIIGPARVIMVDSLKPAITSVLAAFMLGEPLIASTAVGILVSSIGILLVNLQPDGSGVQQRSSSYPHDDSQKKIELVDARSREARRQSKITMHKEINEVAKGQEAHDVAAFEKARKGASLYSLLEPELKKRGFDRKSLGKIAFYSGVGAFQKDSSSTTALGFALAFLNVAFDSLGSVLTKQWGNSLNTWEISAIRFTFASICMCIVSASMLLYWKFIIRREEDRYLLLTNTGGSEQTSSFHEKDDAQRKDDDLDILESGPSGPSVVAVSSKSSWFMLPSVQEQGGLMSYAIIVIGCLLVTFACPALSTFSLQRLPLSLSQTLGSFSPLYSILISILIEKERRGIAILQTVFGAILAVLGVAILYLF